MRRTKEKTRLLLLLAGVALIGFLFVAVSGFAKQERRRVYPADGRLDLRDWDYGRDGSLSLSGEWEFYWHKFLTYGETAKGGLQPDLVVKAPGVWNSYKLRGKNLPGFGYATYRLRVVKAPQGKPLALRIQTFSTAYRLYLNGRLVAANGKVATSREEFAPGYRPRVVEFTPSGTSFEITVHIANFTYARGGMWYAIDLGTREQIRRMDRTIVNKDLFLFGALSVMALYYLSIFLLRRKDRSSLYFALMCLTFMSRTVVYGDYLIYRLLPFTSFPALIAVEYLTVSWFPVFAALMVGELFPEETSGKALKAALIYTAAMTAFVLLTPISFYTRLIYLIQIGAISIGFYAIVCLSKAFTRGRKDSLLVLLGALMVILCAARDMLYQNNLIQSNYGELVPFGLFILLFMQSFVLARRFSEAFRDVEALSQKLLKLDKIKDEFLANTSHELRTPLSGILGMSEALLRGGEGELSGGQRQLLSLIAASSRRLANLVNDILDYAKLKHGDIRLHIKPVRLNGLIQTVVKVFQELGKAKEYEVVSDLPAELPPVLADENRVVQILYNLIGNAVKFTTRGYVKVSARAAGSMIEVCVSDTGEGIPQEKLEDIFKSFEQVDTSLTRKHGGAGLGLSITKQLVELQGGGIRVRSIPGTGSEFYFTLPVAGESSGEEEVPVMALPELAAAALAEQAIQLEKTASGSDPPGGR